MGGGGGVSGSEVEQERGRGCGGINGMKCDHDIMMLSGLIKA